MDLGTSLSAPDVSSLDKNEVIGAILSSCNRPSASMVSLNALKSRFLHLNRRVRSLEAINSSLKVENAAVRAEIALLGDELQTSRVSLYAEVEHRRKDALYIHQVDERINDLVYQIRRYGDFIHILAGIGMNSPIYRAALSIMSNVEAEDALVASIVEAAKDKQSPWSQIVPAVVGPRSPEQYVSAINLTLRTRQDLRERERVCEFWKTTAKLEPNNANLLTPSSSTLTDNNCSCNPDVPSKAKSTVLDEMLKDLKNNDFSESSPSPVSSLTFKSMAEWAENAAKEECFGECSPFDILEEALHEPNLMLSSPMASEQPLEDPFEGINLHRSLSDHRLPSSGSEYSKMSEHATDREPANTLSETISRQIGSQEAKIKRADSINVDKRRSSTLLNSLQKSKTTVNAQCASDIPIGQNDQWTERNLKFSPRSKPSNVSAASNLSIPSPVRKASKSLLATTPKAKHPLLNVPTCRDGTPVPKITANPAAIYAAKIPQCLPSKRTRKSANPVSCLDVPLQSHAQIRKSTWKEPNQSKLTVPQFQKRPLLQSIEHNVVATQHDFKTECNKSDLNRVKPTMATARDPSKRRGVIMTENMNIGSNTISAAMPLTLNDTPYPDLSRFTSQISDLVASLSNSDLGSLEMNGESDSETTFMDQRPISDQVAFEQLRSLGLNALPRICKDIMGKRAVGSPDNQVNGRGSSSLISAAFGSSRVADSMTTSLSISSSSSRTSSSFSNAFDSPTCLRPASHFPLFGLANRQLTTNKSPTFENEANSAPLNSVVSTGQPKNQQSPNSKGKGSSRSKIPSPRKPEFALKSEVKGNIGEKVRQSTVTPLPLPAFSTKSPTTIRSSSKENNRLAPKQPIGNPTHDLSARGSKLRIGQTIFNRFSNSQSKAQSPSTATLPDKSVKSYLSPSGYATSPMKPRSNTINTLSRSSTRPYSNQGLDPPSPSTKPRSNTVNTYSPITRSPLSQHVTNGSHEFQSRSTQVISSKAVPSHAPIPSPKLPSPKPVTSSKVTQPVVKSTAPLRVIKKLVPGSAPRANGHIAPTAAFMLPNIPIVNAGRKVSSSVAPLIPTCPTSANGVISPSQCRSLLRNSLSGAGSLVVR